MWDFCDECECYCCCDEWDCVDSVGVCVLGVEVWEVCFLYLCDCFRLVVDEWGVGFFLVGWCKGDDGSLWDVLLVECFGWVEWFVEVCGEGPWGLFVFELCCVVVLFVEFLGCECDDLWDEVGDFFVCWELCVDVYSVDVDCVACGCHCCAFLLCRVLE